MFCIRPLALIKGEKDARNLSYFALILFDLLTFGDFKLLALELRCEDDSLVLPNVSWFVLPCEVSPSEPSNLMDFHFLLCTTGLSPTESNISTILGFFFCFRFHQPCETLHEENTDDEVSVWQVLSIQLSVLSLSHLLDSGIELSSLSKSICFDLLPASVTFSQSVS